VVIIIINIIDFFIKNHGQSPFPSFLSSDLAYQLCTF
jgi:hypothetical protein